MKEVTLKPTNPDNKFIKSLTSDYEKGERLLEYIKKARLEAVEEYDKFLLNNGHIDDDVWAEEPKTIERFLLKLKDKK